MSREVKRVPMDFDWPQGQVWDGYLMPDRLQEDRCPDCESGATPAAEWLNGVAYVIGGLADDAEVEARGRHMHPYLTPLVEISYVHGNKRPGPQFAEFADGIAPATAGRSLGRDVYRIADALQKAAGLPEKWGWCPTCDGNATVERYPGQRAEADEWQPTEPPAGDGWQMWETTSEGSPISPVLETSEALAHWLADNGASTFGRQTADWLTWLRMIDAGWAPSAVGSAVGLQSGVEYVAQN